MAHEIRNHLVSAGGFALRLLSSMNPEDPHKQKVEILVKEVGCDFRKKGVSIRAELAPIMPTIPVDQPRINQIKGSLLQNALARIPSASSLHISTSTDDKACRVFIRDPVLNTSPDDVEHFFYPYATFNVDCPTDLPMSKIILDKSGGSLEEELEGAGALLIREGRALTLYLTEQLCYISNINRA